MSKYDWAAIKAKIDIVEVIGKSVSLKRKGNLHEGCCPFHGERTPSFKVYTDNYHCFGCGAHGDVVDFIVNMEGCTASEAIERLGAGDFELSGRERQILTERQDQRDAERAQAILVARRRWDAAPPVDHDHPYLVRKEIKPHMARQEGDSILLPVYDGNGDIQSVQTISPNGDKKFMGGIPDASGDIGMGPPMKGGRLNFGICIGRTIVAEGFATGASIHEAIPDRVTVAFSKHGVMDMVRRLHAKGQDVAIASDRNALPEMLELGKELGVPVYAPPAPHDDFNDLAVDGGGLAAVKAVFKAKPLLADDAPAPQAKDDAPEDHSDDNDPVDIWARNDPPELPEELVPPILWRAAAQAADLSGADVGGFVMSMLAVLSAALPDTVRIKVKRSEEWRESARLWVVLIGDPSYKKSPIMKIASRVISRMDSEMVRQYDRDFLDWNEHQNGEPPVPSRLIIDDVTMEAAQEVARYSPDGILALQDELSGWFGGIEKYSGGKGSAKDRSFWLRAYGGGDYKVNRVSRKPFLIDNLSINILGGIQPDAIRRIMSDATDDGLIQRFCPIVLRPANIERDDLPNDAIHEYDTLVERMRVIDPPSNFFGVTDLVFDDEAQALRMELMVKHHGMVQNMETVNRKMSSHLGKYDGMFPRICVLFHAIENANLDKLPEVITISTATRAARFLHEYIMRHSMAFYFTMLGVSDDQDIIEDVAGYILTHNVDKVTMRTFQRGSTRMKKLTRQQVEPICHQLEAMGWIDELDARGARLIGKINPRVHEKFKEKAASEKVRREGVRKAIKSISEAGNKAKKTG